MASPDAVRIVHNHPSRGRALLSTKSIPAGQVIQTFSPTILLPTASHLTILCTYCFTPGSPSGCSRCHASYYCNAACQAADWKLIHGKECKALARTDKIVPTPVRALMQCLLKASVGELVGGLEGHVEKRKQEKKGWEDLELMALGAWNFAGRGREKFQMAVELLCKIQTNAFHRDEVDLGQVGLFLEPTLAMANHSCIPNATVQFMGRTAVLRAERSIAEGEEIEISYTDYTWPLSKRRDALAHYMFECQCPRCARDLNVYEVCALVCEQKGYAGRLHSLVTDKSDLIQHAAAQSHGQKELIKAFQRKAESMVEEGEKSDTFSSLEDQWSVLKRQYQSCKELIQQDLWAVSPIPDVLHKMSTLFAQQEAYALALVMECRVAVSCEVYRNPWPYNPWRTTNLFTMAKLLSNTAASMAEEAHLGGSRTSQGHSSALRKVHDTLQDIDQVSLCQMLLILTLKAAPPGLAKKWRIAVEAAQMLAEIEQLPGRDREVALISSWQRDASAEDSQAFFEFGVVKQVWRLAALAETVAMAGRTPV